MKPTAHLLFECLQDYLAAVGLCLASLGSVLIVAGIAGKVLPIPGLYTPSTGMIAAGLAPTLLGLISYNRFARIIHTY